MSEAKDKITNPYFAISIALFVLYCASVAVLASSSGQALIVILFSGIWGVLQIPGLIISWKGYYFGIFAPMFAFLYMSCVWMANYAPFTAGLGKWPFAIGFVSIEAGFVSSLLSLFLVFGDLKFNPASKRKWQLIFSLILLADVILLLATGKSGFMKAMKFF
jgi:hypothetical protein